MSLNVDLVEKSLRRAHSLDLFEKIRTVAGPDEVRRARRGQIEARRRSLVEQYTDEGVAERRLERLLQGNDLTDISYLWRGFVCARSVGRVVMRAGGRTIGFGTGSLVAPGVMLTNEHVLPSEALIAGSTLELGYERDLGGTLKAPVEFSFRGDLKPIICKELDFALVGVVEGARSQLKDFGWLKLNPQPGKAFVGEYLTIIQHPRGEPKQVCVRENKLLMYDENGPYLWYQTDTLSGSSGSPVFNNEWEVVALHHSSVPRTKKVNGRTVWLARNGKPWTTDLGDDAVDWIANEGIRVSRIATYLEAVHASNPLARAVLDTNPAPIQEESYGRGDRPDAELGRDGMLRLRLPIELGLSVSIGGVWNGQRATATTPLARPADPILHRPPAGSAPSVVEKIVVDQKSYDKRPGYDPRFLGGNALVPMPKLVKRARQASKSEATTELKYWNYSVLFGHRRRLALVSAANIDPSRWRGKRDADGDKWFKDTRIAGDLQVGAEFYKKQRTFEAERSHNPFDQGHLSRRQDVQWGDTEKEAKRNGDDSYHYTNCGPQHFLFNQNSKVNGIWARLESHAANASDGERLCVFNGPVFDAPLCELGPQGRLRLNPKGKGIKDGVFGGVQIPRQFFKVFVFREGNKLRGAGFIVTQEDLLETIDRLRPREAERRGYLTDLEVRLYQVPVATIGELTGLSFPKMDEGRHEFFGGLEQDGTELEAAEQIRW